jgi:3-hydroxyacyl-CoA dehydrogenase
MSKKNSAVNSVSDDMRSSKIDLEELKRNGKIVMENAGASLLDLGDRIGLIEFHTKANSLNNEVCEIILNACATGAKYFDALVIGNRGKHFSAGADLSFLLDAARTGKWALIDKTIGVLQSVSMAIKYGPLPVVAAPFSNALGGGCEVCLHSAKVVAADATYMGLVETGVGLAPAGGGTKELGLRAQDRAAREGMQDRMPALEEVFKLIVAAKVSRNGKEARQLFLNDTDIVTTAQEGPIGIAKRTARELVCIGYQNDNARTDIQVIGKKGILAFQFQIEQMRDEKVISDHDAVIGMHVATILCGGNQSAGTADEQHFLDLEREAFISLLGTEKTQERIEYLLRYNKPLRN